MARKYCSVCKGPHHKHTAAQKKRARAAGARKGWAKRRHVSVAGEARRESRKRSRKGARKGRARKRPARKGQARKGLKRGALKGAIIVVMPPPRSRRKR
jgi:hypothetical protein